VTVEIPIVWDTVAAGLGVLGVVMPCEKAEIEMNTRQTSVIRNCVGRIFFMIKEI